MVDRFRQWPLLVRSRSLRHGHVPFRIQVGCILSLTPVGRTTVYVPNMNRPDRVRIWVELELETCL